MKKKFLICSLMATAALTAAAFAGCGIFGGNGNGDGDGTTYRQDNMRFALKDDGTYEFERYEYADFTEDENGEVYTGVGETVTVPDSVNGKAVSSVAEWAFGNTGVKEVTLPASISVLPKRLFDGCILLEKVNTSVITSVEYRAFYGCEKLADIVFESGLTELGEAAFEGCPSLAAVTLPDTVKIFGDRCFWGDGLLESLNTPNVETLGEFAFCQCKSLSSLTLPNIVSIGERAFDECDKLTDMTIGDKLEECNAVLKGLTKISIDSPIPEKLFQWSEKLTDVMLGDGVTSIGESAFGYCKGVKNITLPSTLTEIGANAFSQSGLTGVVNIPASVKTIGDDAFYGCGSVTGLTIENGVETIGASSFQRSGITSLLLPASVKSVGNNAFAGCNSLQSITFAEGLESIGSYAFSILGDEDLEIVLPSTVKSLGDMCFGSIAAKKLTINDTVETVGENIVKGCKVRELTVPVNYGHNASAVEELTLFGEGEIPANAYLNVATLKTVDLGGGVKRIGDNAFKALETISLVGVEYLGEDALGDLSSLTCLKTENGVKTLDGWVISSDYSQGGATVLDLSGYTGIYYNAFKKTDTNDTSVLNTVMLVGSDDTSKLKFIGANAFSGSGITAVEITPSLQSWNYAFAGCNYLKYISVHAGVEKIADYAFSDCGGLESVNFKNTSLKVIGARAFANCAKLRLVTLPDTLLIIENYAFRDTDSLEFIDLNKVEEIGFCAFYSSGLNQVTMSCVKIIGDNTFKFCQIDELDIPASVEEIYEHALSGVRKVNYDGTMEQWESIIGNIPVWKSGGGITVKFSDGNEKYYS